MPPSVEPLGLGLNDRLTSADPAEWPAHPEWKPALSCFWASAAGVVLRAFLERRLASGAEIYPVQPLRALTLTPLSAVKVVILGQDPYHGPGQAEGLAFSVPPGVRPPPSLRNIHKELQRSYGQGVRLPLSLAAWAAQGVLLLNTCLTVERGEAASHAHQGWEVLTDSLVSACSAHQAPKAFLLWGAHAQAKSGQIDPRHAVFRANHPSPLSATRGPVPFIGCGHFQLANQWLTARGQTPVRWVDR